MALSPSSSEISENVSKDTNKEDETITADPSITEKPSTPLRISPEKSKDGQENSKSPTKKIIATDEPQIKDNVGLFSSSYKAQ